MEPGLMERLLVLRLECLGCSAEALLNGVPLAWVGGPRTVATLPVHEYAIAGQNELTLVVNPAALGLSTPPPEPRLSDGQAWASLRLLLPRMGSVAHPASARTVAQLDWAPTPDEVYFAPAQLRQSVALPIAFPRWRWLDAPLITETPTLKNEVAAYLLEIALGLARGNPEPLILASRLRLEELAAAYQRPMTDDVDRLRQQLQTLHALQPLKPAFPVVSALLLRPVAGGRLLDCLTVDGQPALQSPVAGGGRLSWPLRVAAVEGRFYVLR
jgi:hypothetical protein